MSSRKTGVHPHQLPGGRIPTHARENTRRVKANLTPPGRCPSPASLAGAVATGRLQFPHAGEGDITLPDIPHIASVPPNNGKKKSPRKIFPRLLQLHHGSTRTDETVSTCPGLRQHPGDSESGASLDVDGARASLGAVSQMRVSFSRRDDECVCK